jgi:hypothetical protein
MIRYTFIFGTSDSWSAALLEPRLPNCTSRGLLRGRAIIVPTIYIIWLPWPPCHPTIQDGPLMGPPCGYQTSCESAPWDRWCGRARLPRHSSRGPMPYESTRPCQRWSSIRLVVAVVPPTPFRAELVRPIDMSVGRSALGLTRPPEPFDDRGSSSLTMSRRGRVPTAPTSLAALGGRESSQTRFEHSKSVPGWNLVMPQPLAVLPRPSCRS